MSRRSAWLAQIATYTLCTLCSGCFTAFIAVTTHAEVVGPAHAATLDVDDLTERAKQVLSAQIQNRYPGDEAKIDISPLPSAVIQRHCPDPAVEVQGQRLYGQVPVRINCTNPTPWSFYLRADITLLTDAVVTERNVVRGTTLTVEDLSLVRRARHQLPNQFAARIEDVVGLATRRNLSASQPIRATHLTQPIAVKRGDEVAIRAQRRGITITSAGIAQQDGQVGQQVGVKNIHSKRIIKAWVWGTGLVGTQPKS